MAVVCLSGKQKTLPALEPRAFCRYKKLVRIVFDEPKRVSNVAKHGLDFAEIDRFDWKDALIVPARPGAMDQSRFKAIGKLDGVFVVAVCSRLGVEAISIISLRKASSKERALL
jgi:uncharacterized DUF497 family protein